MRVKEESEKADLKLNIQKSKIMASGPISSVQFRLVAWSCPTLCDPMNHSTPGLPVRHQLPESTQTHVHWVGDAIQPSHSLSSPSPPAINLSQHQGLFQWLSSLHQVANTSWQIEGGKVEALTDFIFLGSKITEDSDCSHEIKRHLLLGRKAMTNLHSIFKNRDITLLTKICLVKAMVFPVAMYRCESLTIKKAEHQRIDDFELRWRRLLRVPLTARGSH